MNLVRPSALPDELGNGYLGRLKKINGFRTVEETVQAMAAGLDLANAKRREISLVELLASTAGMDVASFVRRHTLLPLARAIPSKFAKAPHGDLQQHSLLRMMAMRLLRPRAYFCPRCVEEDVDFHGTSYWRREHQMPGLFWCMKHDDPLVAADVDDASEAFAEHPSAFLDRHIPTDPEWLGTIRKQPPVQRFLAICSELQTRSHPLQMAAVSSVLTERAKLAGLHVGKSNVRHRLLSDHVRSVVDEDWLDLVLPSIALQPRGVYWHPVDGVTKGSRACASTFAFAAVAAVLFDSADEALAGMTSKFHTPKPPRPRSKMRLSDDALRRAYLQSGCCHLRTAGLLGLDKAVTARRLGAMGLPGLGGERRSRMRHALLDFISGERSIQDAQQAHGLTALEFESALRCGLSQLQKSLKHACGRGGRQRVKAPAGIQAVPAPHGAALSDDDIADEVPAGAERLRPPLSNRISGARTVSGRPRSREATA